MTTKTAPKGEWRLEVFYDEDCPLCRREIAFLRKCDGLGRIRFTNIAAPEFDPSEFGRTRKVFDDTIQGRHRDGEWIEGVEVFRQIWSLLGLRWLMWTTRLPGISQGLDFAYQAFAKRRLSWTGRACKNGACAVGDRSVDLEDPTALAKSE